MNLSAVFVARPVATVLLTLGVVLIGALSWNRLPIAALPAVDRPTIGVWAVLPGASPTTVASSLAQPLERQLGIIPGIVEMSSFSATGGTEIIIQFELGRSIEAAAGAVQAAINAAGPNLPRDLPQPPAYYKANPSGFPVIALALTSEVVPPGEVYAYADSVVAQTIAQVKGVAKVAISGAERSAVRIQADPGRLANMGLSLERLRFAVAAASQNLPKGAVTAGDQAFTITADDQLFKAAEYREVVVDWRRGAPVRLGDVAEVSDSVINNKLAGWYGNERAVVLYVYKQPDANVVRTVDDIMALLPQLDHWIPPAIKVHVVYNRTALIRASIADVELTIAIAAALVVLVIALFLRRFWATAISSLTIPVALAATLAAMDLLGFSLDNLSLMALTIAVGFVVDDAVIMIENIMRHVEEGAGARDAALAGARQMGFTVLSITAALIAALIPVLFMTDVVGRYFREFGLTLVVAITASAAVSLTLTPALCGRLLGGAPSPARPVPGSSLGGRMTAAYLSALDRALRHRRMTLAAVVLVTAATVGLYLVLPKGFMPTQDTGILRVSTITIANVSFATMEERQRAAGRAILGDPAVAGLTSYIGTGNGSVLSNGTMLVNLKPPEERRATMEEVIERLRRSLAKVEGLRVFFTPLQDLALGVQSSSSRYQYTLAAADPGELLRWGEIMRRRIAALPEVTDVIANVETSGLQAGLAVDRVRAAAFGITPVAIDNTLYDAFGQRQIRTIYLPTNYSRVILEVLPRAQGDPAAFGRLYVPGGNGEVPLATLTRPWRAHAAMWMRHTDQFPSLTISFDTRPGVALGSALSAIRAAETAARLPAEIKAGFRGEAGDAAKSGTQRLLLFAAALIAIYIVLGVLYESFAHPFTILSTLPPAVFGALLALWLSHSQFTLVTSIACILLVGMVMRNAILMVDFALDAERRRGLPPVAAIREAAHLRLRPITMTMLAAILSALPLALGTGPGYELRQPLGIAIVGGLLVAQLMTLFTTPAIYLAIDGLRRRRN